MDARRLFNTLVLQALNGMPSVNAHRLATTCLEQIMGKTALEVGLQCLSRTAFCWTDSDRSWGVTSLLAYAGVQASHVEYAFSPVLAHLLAEPQGRARIQLAMQRQISTGHTLALYELCAPWVQRGRSPWWPIAQVRAALGCADSAYYETFKHFNAKVLKPAAQELAETSDLSISLETRRNGRAVSSVRFQIAPQSGVTVTDQPIPKDNAHFEALRASGASEALACYAVTLPPRPRAATGKSPAGRSKVDLRTRAARLAVIHRLTSERSQAEQIEDKRRFLNTLDDAAARQDFERFCWMSARNSEEILTFWENLAPNAFAALRENR